MGTKWSNRNHVLEAELTGLGLVEAEIRAREKRI